MQIAVEDAELLTELLVDAHHGVQVVEDVLEVGENRSADRSLCAML